MTELLNMEQLDTVAGGTLIETAEDSQYLYKYGFMNQWCEPIGAKRSWSLFSEAVIEAWGKAGITCKPTIEGDNEYSIERNGKKSVFNSREEAIKYLTTNFNQVYVI